MNTPKSTTMKVFSVALFLQVLFIVTSANGVSSCKRSGNRRLIHVQPPQLFDPLPLGYKHITVDKLTRTAHVAGQVAFNLEGDVVGKNLKRQLKVVEGNLRHVLKAVQANQSDIMRLTSFIVNFKSADDLPVYSAFSKRLGSPAGTVVGVEKLALGSILVEVEITVAVSASFIRSLKCRS